MYIVSESVFALQLHGCMYVYMHNHAVYMRCICKGCKNCFTLTLMQGACPRKSRIRMYGVHVVICAPLLSMSCYDHACMQVFISHIRVFISTKICAIMYMCTELHEACMQL